jgi:hypothetical protein
MSNLVPPGARTQRGRILALLIEARGQWVTGPQVFRLAAQYSARIHELRALGFLIENKTAVVDGQRHSWFRLVPNQVRPEPFRPAVQEALFAGRHCDE